MEHKIANYQVMTGYKSSFFYADLRVEFFSSECHPLDAPEFISAGATRRDGKVEISRVIIREYM